MRPRSFDTSAARSVAALLTMLAILAGTGFVGSSARQTAPQDASVRQADSAGGDLDVVHVQGNVYMIVGAGANIAVQIGPPARERPAVPAGMMERGDVGVLLVDTGMAAAAEKIRAAVRTLSPDPIRYIINTHDHDDHVAGNQALAHPPRGPGGRGGGAPDALVLAHETVLGRMSAGEGNQRAWPQPAWPTDAYLDLKEFWFNNEAIQVFHHTGHTDGDSIVFFRRSDVVSAGDVFVTTSFPIIDAQRGGNIQGIIAGLNRVLDLAIVSNNAEGGTLVIPGHGRLSDEGDVVEYRNMVVMIRDRIEDLIKRGMTLDQVKGARPALDYEYRYGKGPNGWTTDRFVEAVYTDLIKTVKPAPARSPGRSQTR